MEEMRPRISYSKGKENTNQATIEYFKCQNLAWDKEVNYVTNEEEALLLMALRRSMTQKKKMFGF
ncbi:hypothetical protein CR513_61733, partial [Mucuna pruriens]